jgi:paraquat-inducible protein B
MSDAPPDPATAPPARDGQVAAAAADVPQPRVVRARRWNVSMVWLLPAVAVAIAASMLLRSFLLVGPRIQIEFETAEGIEAGKTEVRYKEVVIGRVTSVTLRDDRMSIIAGVQLDRSASDFAVEDTTFWVVRPRIGVAGISGLGTLLSGAYIGVDGGVSQKPRSRFVGLEAPPFVLRGEPGLVYVLRAEDLGSLEVGSPVFHRRTRVGRVVGYTLDAERDELSVKVFVEAPYHKLVARETRFWNASGVELSVNAGGLTLNTQTIASILTGGLAFDTPAEVDKPTPAPGETVFTLFENRRAALAPPDGVPVPVRMVFEQSIRGLVEGAAVDLLGIDIGTVRSISLQYDGQRRRFPIEVIADIYPLRLGSVRTALLRDGADDAAVLQRLIGNGLRAQLRTGNLLTGQMYVALDFLPGAPRARPVATADGTLVMPTVPGTLSEIQPQIADIVQKVSKIPFDEIGRDLRSTLSGANAAIRQLTPEAQKSLAEVQRTLAAAQASLERLDRNVTDPNAPVQRNLEQTLLELQRTSRALRVLSEYLQRHPESLLRGKPADPSLPQR